MNTAQQITRIIAHIDGAKNAGDYHAANLLFVSALHQITRNKRDLGALARWGFIEHDPFDFDSAYYDLLNIECGDAHTCIPVPMLAADVVAAAYESMQIVERRDHCREINPALPDAWSECAYGWMRTGEEALPDFLSEAGLVEVRELEGRRILP